MKGNLAEILKILKRNFKATHFDLSYYCQEFLLATFKWNWALVQCVLYLVFNAVAFASPLMASNGRKRSISHCLRGNYLAITF